MIENCVQIMKIVADPSISRSIRQCILHCAPLQSRCLLWPTPHINWQRKRGTEVFCQRTTTMSTMAEVAELRRPQYPPDVVISLLAAAALHHMTAAAKTFSLVLAPLINILTLVMLLAPQLGCGFPPLSLLETLGAILLLIYHLAALAMFCTLTLDLKTLQRNIS
ncbi:hypothetical protein B0H19DRAFT_237054 [Mycena capillaripes]|nr:hypothetical protein B0H19DRAFT_237054 [Mycena capillaripes]